MRMVHPNLMRTEIPFLTSPIYLSLAVYMYTLSYPLYNKCVSMKKIIISYHMAKS